MALVFCQLHQRGNYKLSWKCWKNAMTKLNSVWTKKKHKLWFLERVVIYQDRRSAFTKVNQIEVVNSYCYLGFTFITMHSAKLGTNHLAAKGKKTSLSFMQSFSKMQGNDLKKCLYYFSIYSSEIWGLQTLESIEKVHMLACKRFLGVPIRTPNTMIYGLARYPLLVNSDLRCIQKSKTEMTASIQGNKSKHTRG